MRERVVEGERERVVEGERDWYRVRESGRG